MKRNNLFNFDINVYNKFYSKKSKEMLYRKNTFKKLKYLTLKLHLIPIYNEMKLRFINFYNSSDL